jgi:hypothetical protein
MNHVLKILLLFSIVLVVTSCGTHKKITYRKQTSKPLQKIIKNIDRDDQTYFIHYNDSIHQVINHTTYKTNDSISISGSVRPPDSLKLALYNEMLLKGRNKFKIADSTKRSHANQSHIFVDQLSLTSSNNFTIPETHVKQHVRFGPYVGWFPGLSRPLSLFLTVFLRIVLFVFVLLALLIYSYATGFGG